MKLIVALLLTLILSFVAGIYLPWWSIAPAAFIVAAFIRQTPFKSFLSGFLGLFILWGGLAQWIDVKNQGLLSQKIATIIPLGGSAFLLVLVTGLLGAVVAGMAALSGSYIRK